MSERKFAGERGASEAAQSRRVVRTKPGRSGIGRHQARFQHPRDRLRVAALGPNGRERIVRRAALIRAIENLPIAELPASTQADASSTDATKRKRNHRELASGISSRITYALAGLSNGGALSLSASECGNARQSCARDDTFEETAPASAGIVTHISDSFRRYRSHSMLRLRRRRAKALHVSELNFSGQLRELFFHDSLERRWIALSAHVQQQLMKLRW